MSATSKSRRNCRRPVAPRLLIGVNSRDLVTLKVVPGRLEELVKQLPTGVPRVAESGVGIAGRCGAPGGLRL